MDLQTRVTAPEGIMATEVDGQAELMHVDRGFYYGLNEVGALLWRNIGDPVTVQELCDAVMEEFDVDFATCQRDVLAVLGQMAEAGLIARLDS